MEFVREIDSSGQPYSGTLQQDPSAVTLTLSDLQRYLMTVRDSYLQASIMAALDMTIRLIGRRSG